jgi:hypothetical protein
MLSRWSLDVLEVKIELTSVPVSQAGRKLLVFVRHHPENVLNHFTKGVEDAFMAGLVQYGGSFSLAGVEN